MKKKGQSELWRAKSLAGQEFHVVAHDLDECVKVAKKFFKKDDDEIVEVKYLTICYGETGVFPDKDE